MASNASLRRDGETLRFGGVLDRAAATELWPQASAQLRGARGFDLSEVTGIDSAGLALLAELAGRLRSQGGQVPTLVGTPPGLEELRAAYRLDDHLDFQA